jgi:hypothetical protein
VDHEIDVIEAIVLFLKGIQEGTMWAKCSFPRVIRGENGFHACGNTGRPEGSRYVASISSMDAAHKCESTTKCNVPTLPPPWQRATGKPFFATNSISPWSLSTMSCPGAVLSRFVGTLSHGSLFVVRIPPLKVWKR